MGCRHPNGLMWSEDPGNFDAWAGVDPRTCKVIFSRLDPWRRPRVLCDPAAGDLMLSERRFLVLHPHSVHGLVHDSRAYTLQLIVPPSQRFAQPVDCWTRDPFIGIVVTPGPN